MNIIKVDAFESSLQGRHIRWILPFDSDEAYYPPGFLEQCLTESPPFQRKLLVMDTKNSEAWKLVDRWDAIFVPQSNTDWSLIITYLQHQPTPTLIILLNETIPHAFFTKCRGLKGQPTIIHLQSITHDVPPVSAHHGQTPIIPYDEIFLPKIKEDTTEILQHILQQSISLERMKGLVLKDIFRDLRSAGASLVISYDRTRLAGLYWYYMSTHTKKQTMATTVLQTLLSRDF